MKPVPRSRLLRILDADPHRPIRVWTVQHRDAVAGAERRGYLSGDHGRGFDAHDFGPDGLPLRRGFAHAYGWMRDRMAETVPDFSGDCPVWVWLKRPSTRPAVWWKHAGEAGMLVTAAVPRRRLLLSDFDAWHAVLNGWYLGGTEAEEEAVEAAGVTSPAEREASWARIFDLGRPRTAEEIRWRGHPKFVQACVDRIHWHEVLRVREIPPRRRPAVRPCAPPAATPR